MAELKDSGVRRELIGERFGRLIVLDICNYRKHGHIMVHCVCDCGKEKDVAISDLQRGAIKSCGCYRREYVTRKNTTHGKSKTRLYSIWCDMHRRCENPKNKRYNQYGGRNIRVCDEWKDFLSFYEWAINNGYDDNLSIDRINVDEGYSPQNCRWANMIEQQNNTTRNRVIVFDGQALTQAEWARKTGIPQSVIKDRLTKLHWSVERTLTTPIKGDLKCS